MISKRLPQGHSWVETGDGSHTLFSEQFQEACHSTTGAKAETTLHYLNGCKVIEKLNQDEELTILEVGFGLGIGFLTTIEAIEAIESYHPHKKWKFVSLELDENLLEWFRSENVNHPFLKLLTWENHKDFKILKAQNETCTLEIIAGDARITLPKYLNQYETSFGAIYQDAFSPKKNPSLWTVEWFKLLKKYSKENVILSTYSASSSIRKSLQEAGWILKKGEKFGPKRTSTRAQLMGESDPEILLHLERSPTPALRDDNIESFLRK